MVSTLVAFVLAELSTFSTTIYLHRGVTHQALKLHPVLAFLMHFQLFLGTGIVPREWAAVHRKHHRFSDEEGDPHSPYIEGLWKVLFLNFLMYRREVKNSETIETFTPNWKNDLIDRIPYSGTVGPYLGMAILATLLPVFLEGNIWLSAALGVFTWWLSAVIYVFLNAMINSVCHKVGYRNFNNHLATNLQWVALLTGGEGLHNNHHQFPMSARMKAKRTEIDPAWPIIWVLRKLRLADYKDSALARTVSSPDRVT